MALLLTVNKLKHAFSHQVLFEGLSFSIFDKEKIAFIGKNGAGKSTLMKIIQGTQKPDYGSVIRTTGLKVGYLAQSHEFKEGATVRDVIFEGIDLSESWENVAAAEEAISKIELTPYEDMPVHSLSGGWQKKVALARELAHSPDLLLLDEPTNHLDIDSIMWLEKFISQSRISVVIISHDRTFLQNTANRVIELDIKNPDGILSHNGTYDSFLEVKENYVAGLLAREASLKNLLRNENAWLARGAKARTTKQKARIDRTLELRDEVQTLSFKNQTTSVKLDFEASQNQTKQLVELKGVSKSYGDKHLFKNLNLRITAKTRLGLLGPNGIGKSTLVKLIMGTETPDTGEIKRSDQVQSLYFDQSREVMDPSISILKTISPNGDTVEYQGRQMHVRSYLERFLFSGGQVDLAVGKLSGGERARLLLARMMTNPCNLLILDEPTNDLDLQTLAILEDALEDFPGAVILVTHDRSFLENVCDQILAFPEMEIFASVDQWDAQRSSPTKSTRSLSQFAAPKLNEKPNESLNKDQSIEKSIEKTSDKPIEKAKKKLSFKEQRELDTMEAVILEKEAKLAEMTSQSHDPKLMSNSVELSKLSQAMAKLQAEIDQHYERWKILES